MIHSFLMIGQSNMAGRGNISDAPLFKSNKRILVERNGMWQGIYVPVNPDRGFAGRNLTEKFAEEYISEHAEDIGLIPCADGGRTLEQWRPGGLLFDNAVFKARLAMRSSVLKGILWHQGESDCKVENTKVYEQKLRGFIRAIRKEIGCGDIPFILGGLGEYLAQFSSECKETYNTINDIIERVAKTENNTAFASAQGLTSKPDFLHFNTESLFEFGKRYYKVYKTLKSVSDENSELTEDATVKKEIEKL